MIIWCQTQLESSHCHDHSLLVGPYLSLFLLKDQVPGKTNIPDFLPMVADLIPNITGIQLDFSLDSLLPLLIITILNVLLVAFLLGATSDAEAVHGIR